MLRGVRAAIFAGSDDFIGKLIQHGANGDRRERAVGKFGAEQFKNERLRKTLR